MEHNFMMSERGRKDFNNQLLQLVGSIQYTNDLDVHMALITSPNYERTEVEKYAYNDSDPFQVLRKHVDMFGMCQKNPNGLDVLIEDAKQVFKKWGASEPTFLLCNSKLGYQQTMTLEKTQYVTNGADGVKRLKAGPDLKSYRGLNVIHSRHFSMEAGRQPRDLLNRRVRVAEHYKLPAMTMKEIRDRTVMLYDEGRDQMVPIPCKSLYEKSMLPDNPDLIARGDSDPYHPSYEHVMKCENDHGKIDPYFWENMMYNPSKRDECITSSQNAFGIWVNNDTLTHGLANVMYHPKFLVQYLRSGQVSFETGKTGHDIFLDIMKSTTPIDISRLSREKVVTDFTQIFDLNPARQLQLHNWFNFTMEAREADDKNAKSNFDRVHRNSKMTERDLLKICNGDIDKATDYFKIYDHMQTSPRHDMDMGGSGIPGDSGGGEGDDRVSQKGTDDAYAVSYAFMLPYISDVYANVDSWKTLLASGYGVQNVPKYSMFIVRPSIEHYMLGIIVGRGGTGELGATLWGQTELSCYDDAMHGKWGMNYKYHARAVVFNEKHLLRLWDIAFNGYTGGMGTNVVDWVKPGQWNDLTLALDEPLKHDFPDMFVMSFEEDHALDDNLPNPINFCSDARSTPNATMADPENIYNTHQNSMDIFKHCTDKNKSRFKHYMNCMPNYARMHAMRKTAGHASHEGDTHTASLSFSGTMQLKNKVTGQVILETRGTGHCGDSCAGSASIRAGNGSMAMSNPAAMRIM
jgi:hypothetical protein